jgi:hypothetical protein
MVTTNLSPILFMTSLATPKGKQTFGVSWCELSVARWLPKPLVSDQHGYHLRIYYCF